MAAVEYEERVIGCFKGLATGDAIGKQTEMLTGADILRIRRKTLFRLRSAWL